MESDLRVRALKWDAKISNFSDFELHYRPYCGLRFRGLPIASKKMALLSFACGEKNLITSSSKKVSPVAPRCWAYAAR